MGGVGCSHHTSMNRVGEDNRDCKQKVKPREELVSWCFEPSQPHGVIPGLSETKTRVRKSS